MADRELKKRLRAFRVWIREFPGLVVTAGSLRWLRWVRREKLHRMPRLRALIERLGVFPLVDHFYEPIVRRARLEATWRNDRSLPGISIDLDAQWQLLDEFDYREELEDIAHSRSGLGVYDIGNAYFGPGDADFYYSIIRHNKARRIVEIGSGHSTRIACAASTRNEREEPGSGAQVTCIEPYSENAGLDALDVERIRRPVEEIDLELFSALETGDIVFIDSSHMLRPEGDVLVEIGQILPRVAPGVWIHFHDVYTPRDYPPSLLIDRQSFWNEQYLLESFLAFNHEFRIAAALNYLAVVDRPRLRSRLPLLARRPDFEPGSFWIVREPA